MAGRCSRLICVGQVDLEAWGAPVAARARKPSRALARKFQTQKSQTQISNSKILTKKSCRFVAADKKAAENKTGRPAIHAHEWTCSPPQACHARSKWRASSSERDFTPISMPPSRRPTSYCSMISFEIPQSASAASRPAAKPTAPAAATAAATGPAITCPSSNALRQFAA